MRFRVLGPLEVDAAGPGAQRVTPRAAKIRVVLATLLVRPNEIVSVGSLIDELWGEDPPRTATTTLQVYISQLRKLLHAADPETGRDCLVTRPPGYLMRLDPDRLDLTAFEDLHARGRAAMARQDAGAAADLQRRALALWRGPLLSDTPHGALLDSTAIRLGELRTAALEQRIRADLLLGRHHELVGELRALAAELPMREEFHAHLMVALYRTGRQADALEAFARLRRTLVDELAIEPGPPLQQLHGRILDGDTALLGPSGAGAAPHRTGPDRARSAPPAGGRGTAPPSTAPAAAPGRPAAGGQAGGPYAGPLAAPVAGADAGPFAGPYDGRAAGPFAGQAGGPYDGPFAGQGAEPYDGRAAGPYDGQGSGPQAGQGSGPQAGQAAGPQAGRAAGPYAGQAAGAGDGQGAGPYGWPFAAPFGGSGPGLPTGAGPVGELPPPDPLFTGRDEELGALRTLLRDVPAGGCVALAGPAGVGKTALALAVAHQADDLFPDGRVFLTLRDDTGAPLDPAAALTLLLHRCGVPGPLPEDLDGLRRTLDRLTPGRRMLFVLDDAADAEQARHLLPTTPGSTALLTCRRTPALPVTRAHLLDVPAPAQARRLLLAASGRDGEDDGPDGACAAVVEACGRLPSAVRALAGRLAVRPHWSVASLAARLSGEHARLAELRSAQPGLDAALRAGYDESGAPLKRAFRLLGLLPAGPFTTADAAALFGTPEPAAEAVLESLVEARLLRAEPLGGYRLHVLWRLLAGELLTAEEPPGEAARAVGRLADALAAEARRADGPPHAAEWFADRRTALVSALGRAHAAGLWARTVRLADVLTAPLEAHAAWDDWERAHTLALDAAERSGDLGAQSRLLCSLGDLAWQRRRTDAARGLYRRALRAADGADARPERDRALTGLAELSLDASAVTEAARLIGQVLDAEPADPRDHYEARRVRALLALETEGPAAAEPHFERCLALAARLGDRRREAYAARWLRHVRGGLPLPDWTETRPGVWRLRAAA
ncbi:BTAD domain-containing putative transcriptional regulator [Streptomyces sp. W1SF4]|uniref:AfsR/SARP family transcriptional regulator n=1 Tax=Streptomyces sp. W1SF4 TaxID=2305220 RepID=UPI0019D1C967|nr:BTAD domain-containing putative transcriptional regulator [Streptomyces sp. W1SF4]